MSEDKIKELSLTYQFPTKVEINEYADNIYNEMLEGNIDPLQVHVRTKAMAKAIESLTEKEGYAKLVREAGEKHGKSFDFLGSKCRLQEVGTKYDFSSCNHIEYDELMVKFKKLEERKKEIEETLKTLKTAIVMNFDGVDEYVYPPKKTSTSSVVVSFKS